VGLGGALTNDERGVRQEPGRELRGVAALEVLEPVHDDDHLGARVETRQPGALAEAEEDAAGRTARERARAHGAHPVRSRAPRTLARALGATYEARVIPDDIRALIFDCDGTLVDTMPVHYVVWREVLAENGIDFTEKLFYELAGVPSVGVVEAAARAHGKT